MHEQKMTKLGLRKLDLPKNDYDGVYNWPKK